MNLDTLTAAALLMGLFGGTHCALMCGSASSAICAGAPDKRRLPVVEATRRPASGRLAIGFNLGRISAYTALGAIVGLLGRLPFGAPVELARVGFRIFAVACIVGVGLHLVGLPSFVRIVESLGAPLWRKIAPLTRRFLPVRSMGHAFAAGGLWAFMPCGLLYGALAVAATEGTPGRGALAMLAFGLGTLPVMTGLGLLAARLTKALARGWVRRTAGAVVLTVGLWSSATLIRQLASGELGAHACCPRP